MSSTVLDQLLTDGCIPASRIGSRLLADLRPIIDGGVLKMTARRRSSTVDVVDHETFVRWCEAWSETNSLPSHPVRALSLPSDQSPSGHRDVPLSIVREREIDVMLTEEISCNPVAAAWFAERVGFPGAELSHVADSVWDAGRETDVLAVYANPSFALMIENKVAAPLSDGQSDHYRVRGELGVARDDWKMFTTCILAPLLWLEAIPDHGFDMAISYEEIADVIGTAGDARARFRAGILLQAAARAKTRTADD
jgi:hypothetical protein